MCARVVAVIVVSKIAVSTFYFRNETDTQSCDIISQHETTHTHTQTRRTLTKLSQDALRAFTPDVGRLLRGFCDAWHDVMRKLQLYHFQLW